MHQQALLLLDVQVGSVERLGDQGRALLNRLRATIEAARAHELLVVFIQVAFRTGYRDLSPANASLSAVPSAGILVESDAGTAVHPDLGAVKDDAVVVKRRFSAFAGTDLDVLLRSAGITTIVLAGIATSGGVLSTVRDAADRDYRIVVLSDGCADSDTEAHGFLVERVFPRQASVMTLDEWMHLLALPH